MDHNHQSFEFDNLVSGMENLINKTIGDRFEKEALLFGEFADHFIERLEEYNLKADEDIKKGSLQALLFENASLSKTIYLMLQESFSEKPTFSLSELTLALLSDAYKLLEIIPENEEVAEQIRVIRNKKKKKGIPLFLTKLSARKDVARNRAREISIPESSSYFADYKRFPNRNFFYHYLVLTNLRKQTELEETIYLKLIELLNYLWTIDKIRIEKSGQLSTTDYIIDASAENMLIDFRVDEIRNLIAGLKSSMAQIKAGLIKEVDNFMADFSANKILEKDTFRGNGNLKKESEQLAISLNKSHQNWHNSIFLLTEDWKLDAEMNTFRVFILKQFFNFSQVISTKFTVPVEEIIQSMNDSLEELNSKINNSGKKSGDDFIKHFKDAKAEFKRKFRLKIIPAMKDAIIKAEIPKAVDTIETDTSSTFNEISDRRIVTNNSEYSRPIEKSEFQKISPRVLVGYELMPELKAVFPNLKTTFIHHVQLFENKVEEIPEIIDFTIESSISFYEKDKNADESVKITAEGIGRAEKKLAEINELHKTFIDQEVETLKVSIDQFIKEIATIANSETASQINMRIVKLQAIAKSKEIRQNITNQIKSFVPVAAKQIKKGSAFLWQSSERIGKQFKVDDKPQFIASDISDYLATTEIAINKLPYIYQRLFKIEPLKSFELFVGRDKPAEMLSNAYAKWKNGRFAPVVIIGEKGSGKTTILNWFLKTKIHNEKVIFLDLHEQNKTPETFYKEIESLLADKLDPVSPGQTGRNTILALDGLARLFNTEVNGFKYLMKTMKLISETNSQVFWIVSSHLYSWYYIDKSFNISDYFAYHIKLTDINSEDLRRIIKRRHNISGFKLIFESIPSKNRFIKSKKINREKQQSELEDAYFKSLTEFNNNNLSQAFLYWLRSTSELKDDVIYIRQISEIKNNFIKSISMPKMISLKNILVHNGITIEGHSRKFDHDLELSKLHLDQMLDDGLLVKNQDYYLINPLIYSQIINELYVLNLLH